MRVCLSFLLFTGVLIAQTRPQLPPPNPSESTTLYSNVVGWEHGVTPTAPEGFKVKKFADGFENPRWMYRLPNGDIVVAESNSNYGVLKQIGAVIIGAAKSKNVAKSADRITLLRDTDADGIADFRTTFLDRDLNQPFGMLVIGSWFYVANTDALLRFPYTPGDQKITGPAQKIADLPAQAPNQHWTRNIIANGEGSKIYVAVGSASNIAEKGLDKEVMRACILELNPDGSGMRVYASGLRNPVGMDWAPGTDILYTAVNERDKLGHDLVPDYLTSVQQGVFYGWPYTYWGGITDDRVEFPAPENARHAPVPEVDLGAHTASLGLLFYTSDAFGPKYKNGAFIAQHGSWNRKPISGYKVVFVPFSNGKPDGPIQDFLTGFIIDPEKGDVRGRPTGLCTTKDGALLLTDDKTNTIWHISPTN